MKHIFLGLALTLASCIFGNLDSKVVDAIENTEIQDIRPELKRTWVTLQEKGVVEVDAPDKDVRPCFVALQGIVEQVLSNELGRGVTDLRGMIHTPMPATPLCTTGEISKDLVDPSIENDPKRLFTVKARTTIVRDFLHRGGVLYVAYPHEGLSKRTDVQQNVYKQELKNYPTELVDTPLSCAAVPDELVGATYLFKDASGHDFVFAIKMTQAKDPKEIGHFGLWFGPLENESVKSRVEKVMSFVNANASNKVVLKKC